MFIHPTHLHTTGGCWQASLGLNNPSAIGQSALPTEPQKHCFWQYNGKTVDVFTFSLSCSLKFIPVLSQSLESTFLLNLILENARNKQLT